MSFIKVINSIFTQNTSPDLIAKPICFFENKKVRIKIEKQNKCFLSYIINYCIEKIEEGLIRNELKNRIQKKRIKPAPI